MHVNRTDGRDTEDTERRVFESYTQYSGEMGLWFVDDEKCAKTHGVQIRQVNRPLLMARCCDAESVKTAQELFTVNNREEVSGQWPVGSGEGEG